MQLALHLRDRNAAVIEAWREQFLDVTDRVLITHGDILDGASEVPADAILSPANSFGRMDGGIDLAYLHKWGNVLQERVQEAIRDKHDGELPVGRALVVATHDPKLPWLVVAPTMRVPSIVARSLNAYLAFRAALQAVRRHNERTKDKPSSTITRLLSPGLCTASGRMEPRLAALQMRAAFDNVVLGIPPAERDHNRLLGIPDPDEPDLPKN